MTSESSSETLHGRSESDAGVASGVGLSHDQIEAIGALLERRPDGLLTLATRLKKTGGVIESRVVGYSMTGTIPDGARIRIRLRAAPNYRRGEIVSFIRGTKLVVHRVVHLGRRKNARHYLLTCGDSLLLPDLPVPCASILGPVLDYELDGRWRKPAGSSSRRLLKQLLCATLARAISIAMELDVRLAQALGHGLQALQAWWHTMEALIRGDRRRGADDADDAGGG